MRGDDAAVVDLPQSGRLAISTDAHIVAPLFYPGGDIGRLSVAGTVNDLAVMGAKPLWLTASFILEEGLPIFILEKVLESMKATAHEAGVVIIAGDTKVAERGKADGIFITTSGIGVIPEGRDVGGAKAEPGDAVLLSGPVGEHGIAVLAARGELEFEADVTSDVAPLNGLIETMFKVCPSIHVLRDPTRGGVATTLNEIAQQSEVSIQIDEITIPVTLPVMAACEMLGFDPFYVANEGKVVAIVPTAYADAVLDSMHAHPLGEQAVRIGDVTDEPAGRVLMKTAIGGTRVVDVLAGEMLPRIC
jgi:hydrogenase expression/formation protein HypE